MKTKDIRDYIRNMGHERGTVHVLEMLSEENHALRKQLTELAQMFNQMVDTMTGITEVAGAMRDQVDRFRKREQQAHDELGISTNSLDKKDMQ